MSPTFFLQKRGFIIGSYSSSLGTSLLMSRRVDRHPSVWSWLCICCLFVVHGLTRLTWCTGLAGEVSMYPVPRASGARIIYCPISSSGKEARLTLPVGWVVMTAAVMRWHPCVQPPRCLVHRICHLGHFVFHLPGHGPLWLYVLVLWVERLVCWGSNWRVSVSVLCWSCLLPVGTILGLRAYVCWENQLWYYCHWQGCWSRSDL